MRGEYPMLLLVKIPSINRKDILRIPFLYLKKKKDHETPYQIEFRVLVFQIL